MTEFLNTLNKWGKGTLFTYGFLESLIIMAIFLCFAFILKRMIYRMLKKRISNPQFLMRLVKIVLYTIAIYACLSLLAPFDNVLSKIWGSAGILAVVLGFAAQESMGNLVNGVLISSFKPFKIGDLVKINNGEYEGYVEDISLRDTVIRTYENTKIIIPNSIMNKAVLENVSQNGNTKGNFLEVGISYESDLERAMNIMKEEILAHPNYVEHRTLDEIKEGIEPIIVRLTSLQDGHITLRATVYSTSNAEGFAMLSDLRIALKHRFDQEGIALPYPHRIIQEKK